MGSDDEAGYTEVGSARDDSCIVDPAATGVTEYFTMLISAGQAYGRAGVRHRLWQDRDWGACR